MDGNKAMFMSGHLIKPWFKHFRSLRDIMESSDLPGFYRMSWFKRWYQISMFLMRITKICRLNPLQNEQTASMFSGKFVYYFFIEHLSKAIFLVTQLIHGSKALFCIFSSKDSVYFMLVWLINMHLYKQGFPWNSK